jgi:hypothetical protein
MFLEACAVSLSLMSTLEPRVEGFNKRGNLSVGRPPAAGGLQVL